LQVSFGYIAVPCIKGRNRFRIPVESARGAMSEAG
jgi:hypothetical protein